MYKDNFTNVMTAAVWAPHVQYLGIFETEMTHVVIDQAKGEAPVHEGQAPLRKEEVCLAHNHPHTAQVLHVHRAWRQTQ